MNGKEDKAEPLDFGNSFTIPTADGANQYEETNDIFKFPSFENNDGTTAPTSQTLPENPAPSKEIFTEVFGNEDGSAPVDETNIFDSETMKNKKTIWDDDESVFETANVEGYTPKVGQEAEKLNGKQQNDVIEPFSRDMDFKTVKPIDSGFNTNSNPPKPSSSSQPRDPMKIDFFTGAGDIPELGNPSSTAPVTSIQDRMNTQMDEISNTSLGIPNFENVNEILAKRKGSISVEKVAPEAIPVKMRYKKKVKKKKKTLKTFEQIEKEKKETPKKKQGFEIPGVTNLNSPSDGDEFGVSVAIDESTKGLGFNINGLEDDSVDETPNEFGKDMSGSIEKDKKKKVVVNPLDKPFLYKDFERDLPSPLKDSEFLRKKPVPVVVEKPKNPPPKRTDNTDEDYMWPNPVKDPDYLKIEHLLTKREEDLLYSYNPGDMTRKERTKLLRKKEAEELGLKQIAARKAGKRLTIVHPLPFKLNRKKLDRINQDEDDDAIADDLFRYVRRRNVNGVRVLMEQYEDLSPSSLIINTALYGPYVHDEIVQMIIGMSVKETFDSNPHLLQKVLTNKVATKVFERKFGHFGRIQLKDFVRKKQKDKITHVEEKHLKKDMRRRQPEGKEEGEKVLELERPPQEDETGKKK